MMTNNPSFLQQPDLQEGAASLQNELANLKSREAAASNEATLLRDRVKCLENALLEKEVTWQQKKREWVQFFLSFMLFILLINFRKLSNLNFLVRIGGELG